MRSLEEQRRRQQEERLRALPVSATIIVRPGGSGTNSSSPLVFSRGGFGSEIDFPVRAVAYRIKYLETS